MDVYFRINQPSVIGQVIEGEAIIVNLDSGAYYSLDGVGGKVWELIEQGAAVDEIMEGISQHYDGEMQTIQSSVLQLLGELQQESLITPVATPNTAPAPLATPDGGRLPFRPPALLKYTDMADLLLLDPIHEVDETGWPQAVPPQ